MYLASYDSPLGAITLAADDDYLRGLWFDGQRYDRLGLTPGSALRETPILALTRRWLDVYFAGEAPDFTPPYRVDGSEFKRAVSAAMAAIPRGETRSYGDLARVVAKTMGRARTAPQAVGGAVGHNPLSIIVPCHRVVGSDGSLVGYAGGLERKRRLLELEGIDLAAARLFLPTNRTGTA